MCKLISVTCVYLLATLLYIHLKSSLFYSLRELYGRLYSYQQLMYNRLVILLTTYDAQLIVLLPTTYVQEVILLSRTDVEQVILVPTAK
jgi:hypothetical protein